MAVWEYKVISSGKGGFATPVLLETFLNQLGKDQWEILEYHSSPDNPLAFSGLARRPTQRDWTLEDAASAAAKAEADKLRLEFEAKFKGIQSSPIEEKQEAPAADPAPDDGFRRVRNTESDQDPEAPEDEWDKLSSEEELPSFFDAMKPHMRRNQRGPGMSVGVEFLAKKWDFSEEDVKTALKECGMEIPGDEEDKVVYVEYDGDLYWVNMNRRGELWINTKEKPRQIFKTVAGTRVEMPEEEAKPEAPRHEHPSEKQSRQRDEKREQQQQEKRDQAPAQELPLGEPLLQKIFPMMRRNRRGAGSSGSISFLTRGLRCKDADLLTAFGSLGLVEPKAHGDEPVTIEIGERLWWLNKDQRGGIWINERNKKDAATPSENGEPQVPDAPASGSHTYIEGSAHAESSTASSMPSDSPAPAPAPTASPDGAVLSAIRLLLSKTKTGAFAATVEKLSGELNRSASDLTAALVASGLKVPEKAKEKPVFVEHAGEIFWLNRSAKDDLWVNAKASKFSDGGDKKGKRPAKGRKKDDETPEGASAEPAAESSTPAVETPSAPNSEDPAPPPSEPPVI